MLTLPFFYLFFVFFLSLLNTQICREMFRVTKSTFSLFLLGLIDGPVAAVWWWAAGGFLVGVALAVAVCRGVCDTRAAGRCGRTGGWFGFDLQPLVTQSLSKVVIDRDADGELGASLLVVQSQAPLEVLLHHVVIVAFRNHWKTGGKWHQPHTSVSQEQWVGVWANCLTWWVPSVDLRPAGRAPQRGDTSDHRRPHLQIQTDVGILFTSTSTYNHTGHITFISL